MTTMVLFISVFIIYSTFKDLGFDSFSIRINNRKVLNGFFEFLDISNKGDILRTIDKLEKVGKEIVIEELEKLGLSQDGINRIISFIEIKGNNDEVISKLRALDIDNPTFVKGLEELSQVIHYIKAFNVPEENYAIDLTIARGLDYYTGTIYETILNDYPSIGSVCSGGRYDNLAGYYTKQKLPGVGISIGLTRLFYQLREANIVSNNTSTLSEVLIVPMGDAIEYSINTANSLRDKGIITEIYYDEAKVGKKLGYADKLGITYVILIGEDEIKNNLLTLKNMKTGEQENLSIEDIIRKIKNV